MKTISILIFSLWIILVARGEGKKLLEKECPPPEKYFRLPNKPVINIYLDSLKVGYNRRTENTPFSVNLQNYKQINFDIDFVTFAVPRSCYYFSKVEVTLNRPNQFPPILYKTFLNVDSVDLKEFKEAYQKGDQLVIIAFPELKNGLRLAFCPDNVFLNLN